MMMRSDDADAEDVDRRKKKKTDSWSKKENRFKEERRWIRHRQTINTSSSSMGDSFLSFDF